METIRKRHLQLPEILFIAAACFAMGAIGFFLAVYIQLHGQSAGTISTSRVASDEERSKILSSLSGNTESATSTPQQQVPGAITPQGDVVRNQADENSPDTANKLRILESLSQ